MQKIQSNAVEVARREILICYKTKVCVNPPELLNLHLRIQREANYMEFSIMEWEDKQRLSSGT